jgi:hypothetical protein
MQKLKPGFSLVDPQWFRETLSQRGFDLSHQVQRSLPAGKGLWMGIFRK